MKKFVSVAILAATAIALSGCDLTGDYTTEEPLSNSGQLNGTRYEVKTNWTRIPSNSGVISDVNVRILIIENVCYVQTGSEKDWQQSLVPTGSTC